VFVDTSATWCHQTIVSVGTLWTFGVGSVEMLETFGHETGRDVSYRGD